MDTVGYFRIAIVRMLMLHGVPAVPSVVAAVRVMLPGGCSHKPLVPMVTPPVCSFPTASADWGRGKEHYDAEQQAQYPFSHFLSSSLSSVLPVQFVDLFSVGYRVRSQTRQ